MPNILKQHGYLILKGQNVNEEDTSWPFQPLLKTFYAYL